MKFPGNAREARAMLEHLTPESQSGNLKTGTRSYEEITSISFVGGGGGWMLSSKENVTCFAEVTQRA